MPTALLRGGAAALLALTLAACGSTTTPGSPSAGLPDPSATEPAQDTRLAAQAVATPVALNPGQTLQLNVTVNGQPAQPGQLNWTTSNAAVATVTQTGLVSAVAAGSATVRAALASRPSAYLDFPVTVTAAPAPTPTPAPTPGPSTPSAFAQQVLDLTNAARAVPRSCGATSYAAAAPLTWNAQLAQAAQGHATDMATQTYFSHTSLDGRTFSQRITSAGYTPYRTLGENIAAGQTTPQAVVDGWLKSEGHCKNIMNPNFRELGVGYAQGGSYGHYWVQDFGAR